MDRKSVLPKPCSGFPEFIPAYIFGAMVDEVAANVQAPKEMALMGGLSAVSVVCQGLMDVVKPNGQKVPASLMLLTISESGERKTSSEDVFMDCIREYEELKVFEYQKSFAQWQARMKIWSAKESELLKSIRKIQRHGGCTEELEGEMVSHQRGQPERPRRFKMLYNDATPQALFLGMYQDIPSAGLVSNEGGGILNGKAFSDFTKINSIWSGGTITVDRVSAESFNLSRARLVVSMMVQPKVFSDYLSRKGEQARAVGLLARFLTCKPKSIRGARLMGGFSSSWQRMEIFKKRIFELLDRNANAFLNGNFVKEEVKFSAAASVLWRDAYNEIELGLRRDGRFERMPDFATKMADNIARIAALLHYFDGLRGDVSVDVLRYAIALCCWFADEFREIFIPPTQLELDCIELYKWLWVRSAKGMKSITRTEILQYGPGRMRKKGVLDPILDRLSDERKVICNTRRGSRVDVRVLGGYQ